MTMRGPHATDHRTRIQPAVEHTGENATIVTTRSLVSGVDAVTSQWREVLESQLWAQRRDDGRFEVLACTEPDGGLLVHAAVTEDVLLSVVFAGPVALDDLALGCAEDLYFTELLAPADPNYVGEASVRGDGLRALGIDPAKAEAARTGELFRAVFTPEWERVLAGACPVF